MTSVRVSWDGLLKNAECADNIMVKYWRVEDRDGYQVSEVMDTNITAYIVDPIAPNTSYSYQVILYHW